MFINVLAFLSIFVNASCNALYNVSLDSSTSCENFPNIMNIKFTAELENELDEVAEGEKDWISLLSVFYKDLKYYIDKFKIKVEEEMSRIIESDVPCSCGKGNMILKTGRL